MFFISYQLFSDSWLTNENLRDKITVDFRMWRSLVARLNGVQEAASSNLVIRTKRIESVRVGRFDPFFISVINK